jgi:DNA-binding MarR family transcriptional regulator
MINIIKYYFTRKRMLVNTTAHRRHQRKVLTLSDIAGKRLYDLLKELNLIFSKNLKQYFTQWNLTAPQILVLTLLDEAGEMKISDIAGKMGMADSNISGIVDRLEKAGLAERIRSTEDRRIVRVRLTGKVTEIKKNFDSNIEESFSRMLSKFSPDELEDIIACMVKLKNRLKE